MEWEGQKNSEARIVDSFESSTGVGAKKSNDCTAVKRGKNRGTLFFDLESKIQVS
jgi:hypothetical protein